MANQTIQVGRAGVGPTVFGPVYATNRSFSMGAALRAPSVAGPQVSQSTITPAALSLAVVARSAPDTVIATLDDTFNRTFQDVLNDVGSGEFTIDNDDSDLADVVLDRMVRFSVKGAAAFTMLIEQRDRRSITQGEEHDEVTNVKGRGHLAIFEEAVVYPTRGCDTLPIEEDRPFNWSSPVYDDTAWGTATQIAQQSDSSTYWTGLPPGWPTALASAYWVWASSGSQEWAPPGTCYFRRTFTVPSNVSRVRVYFACDDASSLFIEGQQIATTDNQTNDPTQLRSVDIEVSAGTRLFAAVATNEADDPSLPPSTHNPGGLLVGVVTLDNLGVESTVLLVSDASWKIVEYPAFPPGMTPGQVLRIIVEEAQARGSLAGVTLGFTDFVDSSGLAWPNVTDIATKVGTDYLTFLKELTVTYIDIWLPPASLALQAWNLGGRTNTRTVTLHAPTDPNVPATGNLLELAQLQTI